MKKFSVLMVLVAILLFAGCNSEPVNDSEPSSSPASTGAAEGLQDSVGTDDIPETTKSVQEQEKEEEETPKSTSKQDIPVSNKEPIIETAPPSKPIQAETIEPENAPQAQESEVKETPKASSKGEAQKFIGKSVGSLTSAIGQPNSRSYAPSCMGEGEDGELCYSGFNVYTYRENGAEHVTAVE